MTRHRFPDRSGTERSATPLARYQLGRAALDHRQFLAAELSDATGIPLNTVYGFLAELGDGVESTPLVESAAPPRRGAPRKLYELTPEGVSYLTDRNLALARVLRGAADRTVVVDQPGAGSRPAAGTGPDRVIDLLQKVRDLHAQLRDEIAAARAQAASPALRAEWDALLEAGREQVASAERALIALQLDRHGHRSTIDLRKPQHAGRRRSLVVRDDESKA